MRLSALSLLLPVALTCNHASIARQQGSSQALPFKFIPGDDPPADPATRGYFVNHVSLLASNLTTSRQWHSEVLGMHHVFTVQVSEEYSLMYMAHSQGGRSGSGYQTGAELVRDKNNLAGLIEFQHYTKAAQRRYRPHGDPHLTLSHMGLIVDNLAAAQARFDALEVRIIKRAGEFSTSPEKEEDHILAGAWGFPDLASAEAQADIKKGQPGFEAIGFEAFIVIADPDGNLFEVQALHPETF